jgi:hypothetical protein
LEILDHVPARPFACVPLTALWVILARDRLGLPAYQIAGDLYVQGLPAFASNSDRDATAKQFERSTLEWDGHSWLAIGDFIGDLSVMVTASRLPSHSRLRNALHTSFPVSTRLLLAQNADLDARGFDYRPKYALTEEEVSSCGRGARALFE